MSKNKDFIKFLQKIQYSSVSNINLKYNKVFKEFSVDTLIERNKFADSIHQKWIIEEEKKTNSKFITTNDKLKQIINTHKDIAQIQDAFFKTFDKEPLFKQLIKKETIKDKLLKKSLKLKGDKSEKKIDNKKKSKENKKERDESFYKKKLEENNRKPPLGLYNPRYNYIEKHIPSFNFNNESSIPKKVITFKKVDNDKRETKNIKNNSRNIISINSLNHSLTPINKIKKNQEFSSIDATDETNKINNSKINLLTFNKNKDNVFLSQLNLVNTQKNNSKEDSEKTIQINSFPKILQKNIPVPIFNKMSPRFKLNTKNKGHISNADYNPNYKSIFSDILDNNPIDYEERRKRFYLKKIITNYNPTLEYQLFPELNNLNKK